MAQPTILVVEDHSSVRTLLRVVLEDAGFRVIEADDGDQVLDLASRRKPDLIVLDLMMPGMDGERVIEQLHQDSEVAGIPIVVVTAKEEAVGRVGEALGRENVFLKPFDHPEVLERIEALIGPPPDQSKPAWKGPTRRG